MNWHRIKKLPSWIMLNINWKANGGQVRSPTAHRSTPLHAKGAVSGSPAIVPWGRQPGISKPSGHWNLLNHDCTNTAMPQFSPPHRRGYKRCQINLSGSSPVAWCWPPAMRETTAAGLQVPRSCSHRLNTISIVWKYIVSSMFINQHHSRVLWRSPRLHFVYKKLPCLHSSLQHSHGKIQFYWKTRLIVLGPQVVWALKLILISYFNWHLTVARRRH